ncbi:MAG: SPOR domain-containing protein, partial [Sphingobacteriales bacterium]
MRIEKHIAALLYRYQCVTVPGFGAFLTDVRPAQLDGATHTFYPPKKVVSFNANVKNNDGLLANHIALQEKISYTEAVAQINEAVTNWKQSLDNLDILSLKNIGDLGLNAEGSLVFTPANSTNYLAEAFGLSTVVSTGIKREIYKAEAEELE